MKLLKELVEAGVLTAPFNDPSADQHIALLMMADPGPVPMPPAPALKVLYHDEGGYKFWLWDSQGWLCRVTTIEALVILLLAESRIGARNLLHGSVPATIPETLQQLVDVGDAARHRAERLRQSMLERRGERIPTNNGPAKLLGIDQPADARARTADPIFKELDNRWPTNEG